jgi:hypothetical protein
VVGTNPHEVGAQACDILLELSLKLENDGAIQSTYKRRNMGQTNKTHPT